jgi:hypothetical protein
MEISLFILLLAFLPAKTAKVAFSGQVFHKTVQ